MDLIARTLGNAAGLWAASHLLTGISVPGAPSTTAEAANLLVVGLLLALVNSLVKPVAKVLAFPLYVLTFGLFALVVNGAMLMLTSWLTDHLAGVGQEVGLSLGLHVASMGYAVAGSLLIALISSLIVSVIGPRSRRD